MSTINIPLKIGDNYISFPENSSDSFKTIFTNSGIISNIISFSNFDPMTGRFVEVNPDFEYIQQGRGYLLVMSIDPSLAGISLTYDGIPFPTSMNFDVLKGMLFKGYNLVGPDSIIIIPSSWCRVLDASTRMTVTELIPTRAYFIFYDECQLSNVATQYNLPLILSFAMVLFYVNLFRKEAKDAAVISSLKEKVRKLQKD